MEFEKKVTFAPKLESISHDLPDRKKELKEIDKKQAYPNGAKPKNKYKGTKRNTTYLTNDISKSDRNAKTYVDIVQECKMTKYNKRLTRSNTTRKRKRSISVDDLEYDLKTKEIPQHLSGLEITQLQNEDAIQNMIPGSFEDGDSAEEVVCIRIKNDDQF